MNERVQVMQESIELSHSKRGLLYGVISGATWGLDGVILGLALTMMPFTGAVSASIYVAPLVGAALHDGFAGLWVFLYNCVSGRWREYGRTLWTKPGMIVCLAALFGGPIAMSGYLLAIEMSGASYALAITAMYPVVGAVAAVFFLKEKITLRVWGGIILCIIGAIIVGYVPPENNHPKFYLGLGLALLATLGWGLEGVLSTFGMDMVDPDIAIGIREATSFAVYLIAILPAIGGTVLFCDTFQYESLYYFVLAGLLGGLSYIFWYRSLNMTGVGRAMALNITYALWAVFFGWLIADLEITMPLIVGAIIITLGTLLVVANPKELMSLRK